MTKSSSTLVSLALGSENLERREAVTYETRENNKRRDHKIGSKWWTTNKVNMMEICGVVSVGQYFNYLLLFDSAAAEKSFNLWSHQSWKIVISRDSPT